MNPAQATDVSVGTVDGAHASAARRTHVATTSRIDKRDLVFAAVCLGFVVVRHLMLVASDAPPGVDGGNWLTLGHALLGDSVRSTSPVYPPLVPLLVSAAEGLFGAVSGIALVGSVSSVAPAAGAYVVLRPGRLRWEAVALATLLLPVAAVGEATAWGGYPQLLATGSGLVALWMLDGHLRAPSRGSALAAGATLAFTLATSHFVGAVVVLSCVALVALHWSVLREGKAKLRAGRLASWRLPLLALPCAPLVPLYAALGRSLHAGYQSRPSTVRVTPTSVVADAEFMYRDFPHLWRLATAVALVTPLLVGAGRRRPLWLVPTSLLAGSTLFLVATGEQRTLYLLLPVAVLTAGFWLEALRGVTWRHRGRVSPAITCLVVLWAGVGSVTGLRLFSSQHAFYNLLSPGVVAGIEWVREETPPRAVVAVASVNEAPLGWWVEGLARRHVLAGSALQWLYGQEERTAARTANRIFGPGFPDERALRAAGRAGAGYLFVAKTADVYSDKRAEALRARHPEAFAFDNAAVMILHATR